MGAALSGGGSRAAVFGAAALEALGRIRYPGGDSVLQHIGYISSVSGGSVATAYYAEHKPSREIPVLTPGGAYTEEYQKFFANYGEQVSQNFEGPLIRRQLATFRWINSALAARSLGEVLRERLLGKDTLGELSARQVRGDIPAILFNSSFYNSGRRFILTATSPDVADYDLFADLRRSAASRGVSVEFPALSQRMWEGLTPLTPLDLHIDPCPIGVATAVTASASFPPLVGPITFRVEGDDSYWHAGDGGLYENAGVETLFAAFLKKLQEGKAKRAAELDRTRDLAGKRDVVRRAVAATRNFEGINGTWSFDRNGDIDLNTTSGFRAVPWTESPVGCRFQFETIVE